MCLFAGFQLLLAAKICGDEEMTMWAAFFDHSILKMANVANFAQCCKLTLMDGCACLMYDRVLIPLQFVSMIVNLSIHPSIHLPIESKKKRVEKYVHPSCRKE